MKVSVYCAMLLMLLSVASASAEVAKSSDESAKSNLLVPVEDFPSIGFDPTDHYEVCSIEGWQIRAHRDLIKNSPQLWEATRTELQHQLYLIHRRMSPSMVEQLQQVTIWVERDEPHHACMVYHPNVEWLEKHGMNPEKAGCVEVANAARFLEWTRYQPWMVLHELAHAQHDRFLEDGFRNREVLVAYRSAMVAFLYGEVLHISGRQRLSYASTNQMEYFAEATEAYFGTNDFYPFVRSELKYHDPTMFNLMEKLWHRKQVE